MISSSDIIHSKILIVDDQESNNVLLERILRGAGYDTITSTTEPGKVCGLHRQHRYDLILLDLQMPGMDGFEVMEDLKEIEPQDWLQDLNVSYQFQIREGLKETAPGGYLPVIVITGHPDQKLRALQAGARDFISKPYELAEVQARVRNMLEVRLLYAETKTYVKALEQKVQEIAASRDLILHQSDEVQRLYDKILHMGGDPAALPESPAPNPARPHTLLYVEGNRSNQKLVEQIVAHRADIRLLPVVTGTRGIEIARTSMPDVILLDIDLHGFNGTEFLDSLHADPATAHIPVIIMSGKVLPPDSKEGLKAGVVCKLAKPIQVDEFMAALDTALKVAGKHPANSKQEPRSSC